MVLMICDNTGWLVVFYSTSTLVGYLMPKAVYTYISNIYDL